MLKCVAKSLSGWLLAVMIGLLMGGAIAAPAEATGVYQMPPLSDNTWVVDDAGVLSRINEGKIEAALKDLADKTGYQTRFITLHRLDYGETPETFADALLKKWFPDEEQHQNQILLVLDDVTNGVALKVGDAAATTLTDEIATSVVNETIAIPLRQGSKYNQALLGASDRLVAVLSGEPDPGPPVDTTSYEITSTFASAEETEENRSNATLIVVGFLIAATVIPMVTYYIYQSIGG